MDQQGVIMIVAVVLLIGLMLWQQWQTRRRRQKRLAAMHIGDEVMTIGGIIGELTHLDPDGDRARIEIAPGVEVTVVLAAISRTLAPTEE